MIISAWFHSVLLFGSKPQPHITFYKQINSITFSSAAWIVYNTSGWATNQYPVSYAQHTLNK